MRKTLLIVLLLFGILFYADGKKLSGSRRSSSSSRASSRKSASNPQPTSFSHAAVQPSAPKPSLFGWQESGARKQSSQPRQSQPRQSQPPKPTQTQTHSYPQSNSGLSGNGPVKQPVPHQESVQKSNAPQLATGQQSPSQTGINRPSHSYPPSNGLSGSSGSGYPQQPAGHAGSGAAPPPYSAAGGAGYNQQQPPAYSNVGYPKQQGPGGAPPPYNAGNYGGGYQHPAPPPPYSPNHGSYGGYGGYGGHGGYGGGGYGSYNPINTPQMPGYFGNYGNRGYGGVSRGSNILTGVGIAGAGVGTILTGLALWNLARSTGQHHHTVIYDNRGQPVAVAPNNSTEPVVDPILGDLVNCTLTISTPNATEVLAIPCAIATSFSPDVDVKDAGANNNPNDNTKCTVTVVTKQEKEFMTTIPCSTLLNTAAENNVTEPPPIANGSELFNGTMLPPNEPIYQPLPPVPPPIDLAQQTVVPITDGLKYSNLNCTFEEGANRDPLNPCLAVTTNLTVIPLESTVTPPVA